MSCPKAPRRVEGRVGACSLRLHRRIRVFRCTTRRRVMTRWKLPGDSRYKGASTPPVRRLERRLWMEIMLNSLDLPTEPSRTRVVVAMSGGVDFVRGGGPPEAGGLRRRRHHAAALRSRRGDASQGRLLRRAGHPRRPPGRGGDRHPALRARLRGALPRGGDRPLRRELSRRRDADPLRRVQPLDQVPRPPRDRAGPRRRRAGDRPLRREPRACRTGAAPCTARADPERDQSYFLYATTPEQLACLRFPLGRAARRTRRGRSPASSASRSPTRPTARTSASCRRAATAT